MPEIPPDNEIAGIIRSLNEKQQQVFNMVYKWYRNFYCWSNSNNLWRSTGKSHLTKAIYKAVLKELLYNGKDPEEPRLLLVPTGISAVNIGGTAFNSGRGIKPDPNLLGLSDKMKTILRKRLSEVKMILIDELPIFLSELFYQAHAILLECFFCTISAAFAGLAVVSPGWGNVLLRW